MESSQLLLIAAVSLGFGIINCFFGYRFFRFVLAAWGFLIGVYIGLQIGPADSQSGALLLGIVLGLIGSVLMYGVLLIGLFLLGATLGVTAATLLMAYLGQDTANSLVLLVAALAFGLLAMALRKQGIILLTALSGAAAIVNAALVFVPDAASVVTIHDGSLSAISADPNINAFSTLAWIVLALMGALSQSRRERLSR